MIETLLGGLLGGAFRLAPEILKWLDRNGERSHELSMQTRRWSSRSCVVLSAWARSVPVLMQPGIPARSMH